MWRGGRRPCGECGGVSSCRWSEWSATPTETWVPHMVGRCWIAEVKHDRCGQHREWVRWRWWASAAHSSRGNVLASQGKRKAKRRRRKKRRKKWSGNAESLRRFCFGCG
jgi:hypothetical protein